MKTLTTTVTKTLELDAPAPFRFEISRTDFLDAAVEETIKTAKRVDLDRVLDDWTEAIQWEGHRNEIIDGITLSRSWRVARKFNGQTIGGHKWAEPEPEEEEEEEEVWVDPPQTYRIRTRPSPCGC